MSYDDWKLEAPEHDTEQREPGCLCQWEAGDSACPVHGEDEPEYPACPFHSAGNEGRCSFCEDQ